jgi:hypothetical protein
MSHPIPGPPVVAIHNNLETFFPFLQRAGDPDIFQKRKYRGDRGLFWLGDPKLVFVTAPVPGAPLVCERWGYPGTTALAPEVTTGQLSLDILHEDGLVARIVEYAGPDRTIQLIPYATTAELFYLVEGLRTRHGLTVLLPESPAPEQLWVRDYADTKSGFRALAAQCLGAPDLFPPGFVCSDQSQAAGAVEWFLGNGRTCVVKADRGESGLGHAVFSPDRPAGEPALQVLQQNPFLCGDVLIVDQYIGSPENLSPSFEFFVPPRGAGEPHLTYVSQQTFSSFGRFAGVLLSRDFERAGWYPLMLARGLKLGGTLQELGYVGHFDLDAVVDEAGHPYLLEINARRTGGTYVHEFACHTFGSDYLGQVVLLSVNAMPSGGITSAEVLLDRLGDLLYPAPGLDGGVVVTVTSTLHNGEFGCILVAPDEARVMRLHETLSERIRSLSTG